MASSLGEEAKVLTSKIRRKHRGTDNIGAGFLMSKIFSQMENWKACQAVGTAQAKSETGMSVMQRVVEGEVRGPGATETPKPAPVIQGLPFYSAGGLKILRKEVTRYHFGQQAWPLHPPLHLLILGVSISEIMTVPSLLQYWIKWGRWPSGPACVDPTYSSPIRSLARFLPCSLPNHCFPSPLSWFFTTAHQANIFPGLVLGTGLCACTPPALTQFSILHICVWCSGPVALPTPAHLCCRVQSPKREWEIGNRENK